MSMTFVMSGGVPDILNKVQIKLRHGNMHKSQKENKKNTRKFQAI